MLRDDVPEVWDVACSNWAPRMAWMLLKGTPIERLELCGGPWVLFRLLSSDSSIARGFLRRWQVYRIFTELFFDPPSPVPLIRSRGGRLCGFKAEGSQQPIRMASNLCPYRTSLVRHLDPKPLSCLDVPRPYPALLWRLGKSQKTERSAKHLLSRLSTPSPIVPNEACSKS